MGAQHIGEHDSKYAITADVKQPTKASCAKKKMTALSRSFIVITLLVLFGFTRTAIVPEMRMSPAAVPNRVSVMVRPVPSEYRQIRPVDRSFLAFAFETASFVEYMGNQTHPNEFSKALIHQITSRTGGIPIIRTGGTSCDNATYDPNQLVPIMNFVPDMPVGQLRLSIGPAYFASYGTVPNAQHVVQFPMRNDDLQNTLLWAGDAVTAIGIRNIQAIELGNEPDLYPIDEGDYVARFRMFENALSSMLGLDGKRMYQGISGASSFVSELYNGFEIMDDGLDSNGAIRQVSYHYYQTEARQNVSLHATLMNHTMTKRRLDAYKPFISYMRAYYPDVLIIMGEVGNSLTPMENPYPVPLQSVLGSALWQVDFQLYLMSIGFDRIHVQQLGLRVRFDMWYPALDVQGTPPQVLPPFYAQPFVADFIGMSGLTEVYNIDLDSNLHSAYMAFQGDKLKRIALLNLKLWDVDENLGPRPVSTFVLDVGEEFDGTKVRVEALTAPEGARARHSIAWANQQWTYANPDGFIPRGRDDTRFARVRNGMLLIEVEASSAVMLFLL